MKKIYSLIAILFFAAGVFAQSNQPLPFGHHPLHVPVNIPAKHVDLSRTVDQLYIDYHSGLYCHRDILFFRYVTEKRNF